MSIPLADERGYLVPVARMHAEDAALVRKLADWRERNMSAYPTQFPVTVEGTTSWLKERVLAAEDRMLFLVLDRHGRVMGHLGLTNCLNDERSAEVDNVVRGVEGEEPGIMSLAMKTLLGWTEEFLAPAEITLRVFADNSHAISYYEKLGFVEEGRIPLRKHVSGERIEYLPLEEGDSAPQDRTFVRMRYERMPGPVGDELILTAGPSISARESVYALDAARNGWNREWSKYLKKFEEAFADYVGVKYAIATSCCTGAMHIALLALDIGPGDEVIVPDLTWVATAAAVCYTGATPVFADVEPDSWCLDAASVEACVTEKTKAVMPVHLYGHPARMDRIMAVARKHNLRVVEDAAPSIGAEYEGRRTGSFGDFACFSFQGAKLLVTGEGGIILTDDEALHKRAYKLWDQGRVPGTFWIDELGWKYKMANVQAAIGLGQLERIGELVEAKRRIFSWYEDCLGNVPGITLNREVRGARSIYWMTTLVLDEGAKVSRDEMIRDLKEKNVDTRPLFPPISSYSFWPRQQDPKPVAERLGRQGINLPSGVRLKREEVEYVGRCICEILGGS